MTKCFSKSRILDAALARERFMRCDEKHRYRSRLGSQPIQHVGVRASPDVCPVHVHRYTLGGIVENNSDRP